MKKFSSTINYIGECEILVNSDRILFVERLSAPDTPDRYVVHFDNKTELELEAESGKILVEHLERDGESYLPAPQISFTPTPRPRRPYRRG